MALDTARSKEEVVPEKVWHTMVSRDSAAGSMVAVQLTIGLKPDVPSEAERIKKCKARVFALQDEPKVPRVWLPFDDAPGLAMARAFGDFCLKDYGVILVPEFFHWPLRDKDQFVILTSDEGEKHLLLLE